MKRNRIFYAPDADGVTTITPVIDSPAPAITPGPSKGLSALGPVPKVPATVPVPAEPKPAATPAPAATAPELAAASPVFDPNKFATEFGKSFAQSLPQSQPPAPAAMTPEEAKKLLKVWEPDEAWYAKYDNLDTRAAAIAEQRDGVIRQADTIMQYRMQEFQEVMDQKYGPVLAHIQQQETQARETRFTTTYPALADKAYQPLLNAIVSDFGARGQKFDSEATLFKALADAVEATVKVSNPNFSLAGSSPAQQPKPAPATPANAIPVTSSGHSGSAATPAGPPAAAKSRGLSIFDIK